jgi:hypothetical protein
MQAARRVLSNAGILSRRSMATAAQLAADASKPKGSLVDTLGVFTVTPLAVGVFIYDIFIAHEDEFEGEIPPYPYMRMRTRETFPWGSDLGLFEKHQHVHPLQ